MGRNPLAAALPPEFDHSTRRLVDRLLPRWVTPNGITIARLALVPIVVIAAVMGRYPLALNFFIIAIVSDAFDGPLARVRGQVSSTGKVLDPLADKVIVLVPFWTWWVLTPVEAWVTYAVLACGVALTIIEIGLLTIRIQQMIADIEPSAANLAGKTKVWFEGWMVGLLFLESREELTQGLALGVGIIAIALAMMSSYLHRHPRST